MMKWLKLAKFFVTAPGWVKVLLLVLLPVLLLLGAVLLPVVGLLLLVLAVPVGLVAVLVLSIRGLVHKIK